MANDFLRPSNSKIYEKSPSITKPRYSEHILLVLWLSVTARLHCSSLFLTRGFHFVQRAQYAYLLYLSVNTRA